MKQYKFVSVRTISLVLILVFCVSALPYASLPVLAVEVDKFITELTSPFPKGFTIGDPRFGVWAYEETETYDAMVAQIDQNVYFLYLNEKSEDVSQEEMCYVRKVLVSKNDLHNLRAVINEMLLSSSVRGEQDPLMPTIVTTDDSTNTRDIGDSLYLEATKEKMRRMYGSEYSNRSVYSLPISNSTGTGTLCNVHIYEGVTYYSEKETNALLLIAGWLISDVIAMIQEYFKVKYQVATAIFGHFAEALVDEAERIIMEDLKLYRFKGTAFYDRYGGAVYPDGRKTYYDVTASKTVTVKMYVGTVVTWSALANIFPFGDTEEICLPSEYEFDAANMAQKIKRLYF